MQSLDDLRGFAFRPASLLGLDTQDFVVGAWGMRVPVGRNSTDIPAGGITLLAKDSTAEETYDISCPAPGGETQVVVTSTSTAGRVFNCDKATHVFGPDGKKCKSFRLPGPGGSFRLSALSSAAWAMTACMGSVSFSS